MGDLAELTGAGRSDILPGHTLSPLSLKDFGELEREIEGRRIAEAKVAADGTHPDVALLLLKSALNDVSSGKYGFGKPHFNAAAMSSAYGGLLLFLSLRHAHKDITREKSDGLADTPNGAKARDAVAEMSGFKETETSPGGSNRPIDWHALYRLMEKLGVSYPDIGNLTLAQVKDKLGMNDQPAEPPKKTPQQKQSERVVIFDTLCAKHGLTPQQLAAQVPDVTAEQLKAEGYPMIEAALVPQWVQEYVAGKNV